MRRELIRRILDLPESEQVLVFAALSDHLQARPSAEAVQSHVARREKAVEVLRRVSDHYGLDDNEKRQLSMRRFDRAPKRVRKGWSAGRVGAAWETWENAKKALLGEPASTKLEERQAEGKAERHRLLLEEQRRGLTAWLKTKPRDRSRAAYDRWRQRSNERTSRRKPRFVKSATLIANFGLPWDQLVAFAEQRPEGGRTGSLSDEKAEALISVEGADEPDPRGIDLDRLGPLLRAAREARGMNQQKLTDLAGLHRGQIARLEKGERKEPLFETVARLAIALRVPTDYFLLPEGSVQLPRKRQSSAKRKD